MSISNDSSSVTITSGRGRHEQVPPAEPRETGRSSGRCLHFLRRHLVVCVLAIAAACFALVDHQVLFPHQSGDLDEAIYVLQARALAAGHLTLSAADHDAFFHPWLTGEHDGRLYTKYLPGFAAVLAVPIRLFGTPTPALGPIAAGWLLA